MATPPIVNAFNPSTIGPGFNYLRNVANGGGPYGYGANSTGTGPFRTGTYSAGAPGGATPQGPYTGSQQGFYGVDPAKDYFDPGGGYKPMLSADATQNLARQLGGTAVINQGKTTSGPYSVPMYNSIQFGGPNSDMRDARLTSMMSPDQIQATLDLERNGRAAGGFSPVAPVDVVKNLKSAGNPYAVTLPKAPAVQQPWQQLQQHPAGSYISNILGGNQQQSSLNSLMGLFSLLGSNAVNTSQSNPLAMLMSMFGGGGGYNPYFYTGNRYSLFM